MDAGLLGEVVRGLLPTVGVSLLFGWAIWAIVRADATERAERARLEAEEDAAIAAERAASTRPDPAAYRDEDRSGDATGGENVTQDDTRRN